MYQYQNCFSFSTIYFKIKARILKQFYNIGGYLG
ncbi:uncharacterized protein METZ01_LOCUS221435, partial [marine metagenome]